MTPEMMSPADRAAGARDYVFAGELDGPENSLDLHRRQAVRLARRFNLTPTTAALIAGLYFREAA